MTFFLQAERCNKVTAKYGLMTHSRSNAAESVLITFHSLLYLGIMYTCNYNPGATSVSIEQIIQLDSKLLELKTSYSINDTKTKLASYDFAARMEMENIMMMAVRQFPISELELVSEQLLSLLEEND